MKPAGIGIWGGQGDWQCLEELDGSGDIVARYTYAPGYIDAVAMQERDLNSDGDFADSDEVVYYHSTTLYSVYALSDSNESVVERYRYDAYGEGTVLDADHSSDADGASDVENPYLYTGRRLDSESGLMQYRHRYYSVGLGRFVSRDPVGYRDGYCLYEYATGEPVIFRDPMGKGILFRSSRKCSITGVSLTRRWILYAIGIGPIHKSMSHIAVAEAKCIYRSMAAVHWQCPKGCKAPRVRRRGHLAERTQNTGTSDTYLVYTSGVSVGGPPFPVSAHISFLAAFADADEAKHAYTKCRDLTPHSSSTPLPSEIIGTEICCDPGLLQGCP